MDTFAVSPEEYLVRSTAQDIGVDPDLAARVAKTESGFDQSAVSPKGARGVMQLMPQTAKDLGVDVNDTTQNIRGGVLYFKSLLDKYGGDEKKAAAAYNAGPERVDSGQPWPKETQDYVSKVVPGATWTVSPEDYLKQQSAPAPSTQGVIPGMEALGGTPPGIPASPIPVGLRSQPAPPVQQPVQPAPVAVQQPVQPAAQKPPLYMAPGPAAGLVAPGTIDLTQLPPVNLGNGMWGTVRSASREVNGKEILYPTIVNGKPVSDDEAFAYAMKTGRNLGTFTDGGSADAYAQRLHEDWEAGKIPGVQMRAGDPRAANQPPWTAPAQPNTPTPGRQAVFTAENPPPTAGAFGQEKGFAPSRSQAELFADPEFTALMREAWHGYAGEIPQGDTPAESVALGLARTAAGVLSPESMATMLGGEVAGTMLKAAANTPRLARLLADSPAVRKALDIAASSAIPGVFAGYSGYQGIKSGQEAVAAYRKGDTNAATQYGTQAAANLLFAGLGALGVRSEAKGAAAAYPPEQTTVAARPLRPIEQQLAAETGIEPTARTTRQAIPPEQAAATAGELQASGRNLAAQDWLKLAKAGLPEPIPIEINGEQATLEAMGRSEKGRPYYRVVGADGRNIFGGTGGSVSDFLAQRGATPRAAETPASPATEATPFTVSPEDYLRQQPAAQTQPNAAETQPDIQPGREFQVGSRKYTVQSVENGKVTYSLEGLTQKPVTLTKPLSTFQQIVQPPSAPIAEPGTPPTVAPPTPPLPSQTPATSAEQPFTVSPEEYLAQTQRQETQPSAATAAQTSVERQKEEAAVSKPEESGQQTEDIITGTLNPKLTAQGLKDAKERAEDTKNVDQINAGPMTRTQQTAEAASQASEKDVPVTTKPALKPWDLGELQGKPQSEVDDQINHYIAHPDVVVPGGASYNAYKNPLIGEFQQQIADWKPGERILNSTHSIGVQTVQAWVDNGAPQDKSINLQSMLNRQRLKPVALFRVDPQTMTMTPAENTKDDGIFVERHADTPLDNINKGQQQVPTGAEAKPTVSRPAPSLPSSAPSASAVATPGRPQTESVEQTKATEEVHKFSSTQVNLPEDIAKKAKAFAAKIPESSLLPARQQEATTTKDVESKGGAEQRQQPSIAEPQRPQVPASGAADEGIRRDRRGEETTVLIPGEAREYRAQYGVRELSELHSSHHGFRFQKNPEYPYSNDRDYTKLENQKRVIGQAQNFNPRYLVTDNPDATNGPPVVDIHGNAIGGNSRVMTLARVYAQHPEAARVYRERLAQSAGHYGIDPAQVQAMNEPVLVREVSPDEAIRVQNAITDLNKTGTAQLGPAERALVDSKRVSSGTLDFIAREIDNLGEDGTLARVLSSDAGPEIVNRLVSDGAITEQEAPQYLDNGKLTAEGKSRINRLMIGRFFEDSKQYEDTPVALRNKLERIVAPLSRIAARPDWDTITGPVKEAIALIDEATAYDLPRLEDVNAQRGMFEQARYSADAIRWAYMLQRNSGKALQNAFRQYADAEANSRPGTTTAMFAEEPIAQPGAYEQAFGDLKAANRPIEISGYRPVPGFYSQLERSIEEKMPAKASAMQVLGIVRNPQSGVKPDELKWADFDNWVAKQTSPLSKQDVLDYLKANALPLEEATHGYDPVDARKADEARAAFGTAAVKQNALAVEIEKLMRAANIGGRGDEYPVFERAIGVGERPDLFGEVTRYAYGFLKGYPQWANEKLFSVVKEAVPEDLARRYQEATREKLEAQETAAKLANTPTGGKFAGYTLPGGSNYRELLMTLPPRRVRLSWEQDPQDKDTWRSAPVPGFPHSGGRFEIYYFPRRVAGAQFRLYDVVDGQNPTRDEATLEDAQNQADAIVSRERMNREGTSYKSPHWDELNVLAHIRLKDRTAPDGKKVLMVEEIQSDWHQEGKRKGYAPDANQRTEINAEIRRLEAERPTNEELTVLPEGYHVSTDRSTPEHPYTVIPPGQIHGRPFAGRHASRQEAIAAAVNSIYQDQKLDKLTELRGQLSGIPAAPFAKSWHELAFRRVLRYAAENGYDRVAWTTGDQQNDRYDLSKHLSEIGYEPILNDDDQPTGLYELYAKDKAGTEVLHEDDINLQRIEDLVGKEMAEKIQREEGERGLHGPYRDWRVFSGLDLKVGGRGMKGFYDEILPAYANKYGKKWGAKVGKESIGTGTRDRRVLDTILREDFGTDWGSATEAQRQQALAIQNGEHSGQERVSPEQLRQLNALIKQDGMLGFDSVMQARAAILQHDDFATRWDVSPELAKAGNAYREASTKKEVVHSIDVTPAMRESVMQGQPLFYKPGEQTGMFSGETPEQEAERKSYENRLLGERLTAQIKSGLPAKPAKLKAAQTRGLFEEPGPEQSGLFESLRIPELSEGQRSAPYPVGAPVSLHLKNLALEPIELDPRDARHAHAFVTTQSGMELIGRAANQPEDLIGQNNAGVHISPPNVLPLARNLRTLFRGRVTPESTALISALTKAATDRKSVILVSGHANADPHRETALAEEIGHAIQSSITGTTKGHLGNAVPEFFELPAARAAQQHLARTYSDTAPNSSDMATEISVRLMRPEGYKELGISLEDARILAAHYLSLLRREYGHQLAAPVAERIFESLQNPSDQRADSGSEEKPEDVSGGGGQGGRGGPGEGSGQDLSGYRPEERPLSSERPTGDRDARRGVENSAGRDRSLRPQDTREIEDTRERDQAQTHAERRAHQALAERGSFSRQNPYERAARLEKAVALANALDSVGATPEQVRSLTDQQWQWAADLGKVEPPHSDATKQEVVKHLSLIQQVRSHASERGAAPMLGDLAQHLADKFKDDAPKANYSGLGAFNRIFLPGKQLSEVEKASKPVFRAALQAAGSESYAATLMRSSIPAIRQALKGSDHSWEELEIYYVESRLRGLRDRWNNFADQAEAMSPEELEDAMKESPDGSGSAFLSLLSNIEGRQGLAQDLGQTAMTLAQAKDWDNLGKLLAQTFRDAAARVATAMSDPEFDSIHDAIRSEPHMKEADRLYGELLEKPMAESHALNEGVFSDALGPAGRYFPLMAAGREQVSASGRRLPYRKPSNQNNSFATGLSESYDISMDAFAKRLSGAIRGNNKAALIQSLRDEGWAIPEGQAFRNDDGVLAMTGPDGNEYRAVREESSPGRTLIQGRKVTRIPAHFIVMPQFVNRALKPILAREPMDPNSVIALMRWANMLAVNYTPMELVFHTNGVMGALYANTPFLGDSLPAKLLSAPIAKWFDIRRRMYGDLVMGKIGLKKDPLNPSDPENVKKLLEMAKAGALPAKSGKITYSKEYAEETGAKLERASFGPMLYGPHGLDARARVLMYDIWKAAYPKGDTESLHHFVNQIGNYIPEMQGELEKWFKRIGVGPFATAGMTRVVNGIHTFTGTGPGPGGTWKSRLWWWMTASAASAIAIWAVAHKELTGKWPTQDKRAKLFAIPVGGGHGPIDKFRHSKLGDARWGKNNNVGYINLGFFDNPLVMRGARTLGARGALETMHFGGTGGQAAEAAETDILNTLASPALGPATRAAFVGVTGDEPYLTGFRDYRTGRQGLTFMPAVPPKTKPGWPTAGYRALAAAKQLNQLAAEAAENLGGLTGLYTPDQELPKGAGNWWMRSVLDLAAPGLFANSSNPYARRAAIRQQQRALGIR